MQIVCSWDLRSPTRKKDIVEAAKGKPVAVIAMTDYGRMNAKKILADAMKLMGE